MKFFTKKNILLTLLGIFVIMQFFRIDKTNPAVDASLDFINLTNPSDDISAMLKTACYDCHSHETKYPWYSNIAPVSWWIKGHIDEGKKHLNFSEWGNYPLKKANHKLEESAEEVEEKHMPITPYMFTHPAAKISSEQRTALVDFFKSKMK